MKKLIFLSFLLLAYSSSLKAQMFYLANSTEVEECISFIETPLGTEINYRAKGTKKWANLRILNNPEMGGEYWVKFPDKSKQRVRKRADSSLRVKKEGKNEARIFTSKDLFLYQEDETEYLETSYVLTNDIIGFVCSITSQGITKEFNIMSEEEQSNLYQLSISDEDGIYTLKRLDNDYELTYPDGRKKIYSWDIMRY